MATRKTLPNRKYTAEYKIEATRLSEAVGTSEAAKRLGIAEQNIYKWRKLKSEGQLALVAGKSVALKPGVSEVHAENDRLRRELANVKMDLNILKVGTSHALDAYFARQSR